MRAAFCIPSVEWYKHLFIAFSFIIIQLIAAYHMARRPRSLLGASVTDRSYARQTKLFRVPAGRRFAECEWLSDIRVVGGSPSRASVQ